MQAYAVVVTIGKDDLEAAVSRAAAMHKRRLGFAANLALVPGSGSSTMISGMRVQYHAWIQPGCVGVTAAAQAELEGAA